MLKPSSHRSIERPTTLLVGTREQPRAPHQHVINLMVLMKILGFILVLIGVALITIVLGMARSEPHTIFHISDKLLFFGFLICGVGVIYIGSRLMRSKKSKKVN